MAFTTREKHGAVQPTWRGNNNRPVGRMIGVEFEIEHRGGYDKILEALPEPKEEKNRPVTERDGSLHDQWGVEIVFPPYKNAAFKTSDTAKSYFAKAMKALEDAGVESRVQCGMHMNVNTEGWTDEQKGMFVAWFHWVTQDALRKIGGRTPNAYTPQYRDMSLEDCMVHYTHCTAAGIRPNRIEVRTPQATTDMTKIKNLTNFLELLEDWVKKPGTREIFNGIRGGPAPANTCLTKFIEFLDANNERPRTSATIKDILLNGYPA